MSLFAARALFARPTRCVPAVFLRRGSSARVVADLGRGLLKSPTSIAQGYDMAWVRYGMGGVYIFLWTSVETPCPDLFFHFHISVGDHISHIHKFRELVYFIHEACIEPGHSIGMICGFKTKSDFVSFFGIDWPWFCFIILDTIGIDWSIFFGILPTIWTMTGELRDFFISVWGPLQLQDQEQYVYAT